MRLLIVASLGLLCACSWFHRRPPAPNPTLLIVTGAPAGALIFVDGAQAGEAVPRNDHPEQLTVTSGTHKVEVHVGEGVVYREEVYVTAGEHRVVTVLSGLPHR